MSTFQTLGGKTLEQLPQIPTISSVGSTELDIDVVWVNNNTNVTGTTNILQLWNDDTNEWEDNVEYPSSGTTGTTTGITIGDTYNVRVAVLDGTKYYPSRTVSETVSIAFNPSQLSGLVVWYGDTANGVDRNTLSNDVSITNWNDQSGNGNDLTVIRNVGGVYKTAEEAIYFSDSGGMGRATNPLLSETTYTIFDTFKSASNAGEQSYVSFGDDTNNNLYGINNFSSISNLWAFGETPGTFRAFNKGFDANTLQLITVTVSGGTSDSVEMNFNGVAQTQNILNSGTMVMNNGFGICAFYNGGSLDSLVEAYQKEVVIYNRVLTPTEITQVEDWLNDKYTIY